MTGLDSQHNVVEKFQIRETTPYQFFGAMMGSVKGQKRIGA